MSPLHRRVAAIDVHRMLHGVTVLIEQPDGSISKHSREFGGFKRDYRALAASVPEPGAAWLMLLCLVALVMARW